MLALNLNMNYNRMQPTFQRFPQLGRGTEANPYCRRICVQKQKHKYTNTKALWVCLRPSPQLRKTLKGWLHSIIGAFKIWRRYGELPSKQAHL